MSNRLMQILVPLGLAMLLPSEEAVAVPAPQAASGDSGPTSSRRSMATPGRWKARSATRTSPSIDVTADPAYFFAGFATAPFLYSASS